MDKVTDLVARLRRLGYEAQKTGDKILVEFDAHSKLIGSGDQIEKLLPNLQKKNGPMKGQRKRGSKKWKKKKRRIPKVIVTSARHSRQIY